MMAEVTMAETCSWLSKYIYSCVMTAMFTRKPMRKLEDDIKMQFASFGMASSELMWLRTEKNWRAVVMAVMNIRVV
jgi:hypothetical protein